MRHSQHDLGLIGLLLAPLLAQGAATTLADAPLAVTSLAKSNVMFILDNSGGVDVDVLLPTFNSLYLESHVTNTTASNTNGFFYLFPAASLGARIAQYQMGFPGDPANTNPDPLAWRAYYYGYNSTYYNPSVTYKPWLGSDSAGVAFGNAVPTAVRLDPYVATGATYNLTTSKVYTAYTYLVAGGTACINAGCSSTRTYTSTIFPASYYMWNDANHNGVMDAGEGVLYQIQPSTPAYPSGRTYTAELQNFANWFQYYRTPFLSLKGAMGVGLTIMGAAKVGVTDLDHTTPNAPVADMAVLANQAALQNKLYSIATTPSDWTQPLHERLQNVWNYYNNASAPAPVQYACEQNFSVIASPGYLNESSPWKNNHTGVTPTSISPTNYDNSANAPFGTVPYADAYGDTLADWAAYYYLKPMRTDLATGAVPLPPNSHETNTNLHMTTYVLAPGAVPQISSQNPGTPLANPQTVNLFPPHNTSISWPQPCFVCQNTIDDMWHAAINGAGIFVNSNNIAGGLGTIVDDILSRIGAAAAVAVNNANVVQGNNFSYASSYISGAWSGDLQSYPIDLTSGALLTNQPVWSPSASGQLDQRTPASRFIGTYNGSSGIGFNWASLSGSMQAALNSPVTPPGPADGAQVLNFLRGDRTNEGPLYRTRSHVLADIVNAEPVVVPNPSAGYLDPGYQAFATANAGRPYMIYQAANDGMLHAFSASTGAEAWAYVPGILFNTRQAAYPGTSTLVNLSTVSGFSHLYYVDATPIVGDVDLSATLGGSGGNNWTTMLIGGLGKGGRGYYALNVSSPSVNSDAAAGALAMWEFPNVSTPAAVSQNIGYSFGKPLLVKTKADKWVVIVSSGYNNGNTAGQSGGDGMGHLFVLNPSNGALIRDISTGVGSGTSPSGLAQLSAFVANSDLDNTTTFVYGGDLLGNVWRFDLSDPTNDANWSVTKLVTLVDANQTPQPVTSAPEIGVYQGHRFIYLGTGQYLGSPDIGTSQTQTIYGIIDDLSASPMIPSPRTQFLKQTLSTGSNTRTDSANIFNFGSQKGWYIDLPSSGERVVSDPSLALGVLTVTSIIPGTDACTPGGSSFEYFINYSNGGAIPNSPVAYTGVSLGNALASRPLIIKLPTGKLVSLVRQSNATTNATQVPTPPLTNPLKRVYWREVQTH